MVHQHRHDHDRIFASLGFVDRHGIGQHQFIQLTDIVHYRAVIKAYGQLPFLFVYLQDNANITIEDFLLIIIPDLHNLVPGIKGIAASGKSRFPGTARCRIHRLLQFLVKIHRADHAALHRRENLNLR